MQEINLQKAVVIFSSYDYCTCIFFCDPLSDLSLYRNILSVTTAERRLIDDQSLFTDINFPIVIKTGFHFNAIEVSACSSLVIVHIIQSIQAGKSFQFS